MPEVRGRFAVDTQGCPSCHYELVPHPYTGQWVCPDCKYERDTMHPPRKEGESRNMTHEDNSVLNGTAEIGDDAPTITLAELGRRWGITPQGAEARIKKRSIEIIYDGRSRRAVREADLAGIDFEAPAPRELAPPIMRDIIVRPLDPSFDASAVGDSDRIGRLLLALRSIAAIAQGDKGAAAAAIGALATYAVAAESPHGG
jgi:hypothetical protein